MSKYLKHRTAALVLAGGFVFTAAAADITGAGATFIYPLLSKWSADYSQATGNKINYQSIGSGGGIAQIKAKTVDFGSSDKPLPPEELKAAGLGQFPSAIGGVVPVINIPGLKAGAMKLDGELVADIFLGKVAKWNDPRIVALNGGLKLPDLKITVVHRSDGSGTSFNFTNYLSKVSPDWKAQVGEGTAVQWPVGIGGKGNEGVSASVKQVANSIGYVEYAYAKQNKLSHALVKNADGNFPAPEEKAFQAAAANANWSEQPGFGISLNNQKGAEAWPITSATFILVHAKPEKPEETQAALKFVDWAYKNGDQLALGLDYVPLPAGVKDQVRNAWKGVTDPAGKPIF